MEIRGTSEEKEPSNKSYCLSERSNGDTKRVSPTVPSLLQTDQNGGPIWPWQTGVVIRMLVDSVFNNARAYVNREIVNCSIAVDNGKFFKIGRETNMPKADVVSDLKNLLLLPGLIDAHTHLRDEGKAYEEDFVTGTSAAAAGGISTVLDMPNNEPVTMSMERLENRRRIAERKILVNVGFFSEFPTDPDEVQRIVEAGAVGFKLFMSKQVGGLNIESDQDLVKAFRTAHAMGTPIAVHAEDAKSLKRAEEELRLSGHNDINAFLKAHSPEVETKAIIRLIRIAKSTETHIHFCHVSTENGLELIAEGCRSKIHLSCEVTPHHLMLNLKDLVKIGKMAITIPPVRESRHVEALWKGLREGLIDTIGSDHAPHAIYEKETDSIWDVKAGIPGLETTVPLMITEVKRGRMTIGDVVELLSEKPSRIFHLSRKGSLKARNDADMVAIDLHRKSKIDSSKFHSKAKFSPFNGFLVEGIPVKTFVNGILIMDEGEIIAKDGSGLLIPGE